MLQQNQEFQNIINLLHSKIQLYEQMLVLTERQSDAIGNEEKLNELEQLIQEKQQLINKVNETDAEYATQAEQIKIKYNLQRIEDLGAGNRYFTSFQTLQNRMYDLLQQIQTIENQNIQQFTVQMEEVKAELDTVRNGKMATKNYYVKPIQEGGYFINRRR